MWPWRRISMIRISIHALREEGDEATRTATNTRTISIHALREEGDFTEPRLP